MWDRFAGPPGVKRTVSGNQSSPLDQETGTHARPAYGLAAPRKANASTKAGRIRIGACSLEIAKGVARGLAYAHEEATRCPDASSCLGGVLQPEV